MLRPLLAFDREILFELTPVVGGFKIALEILDCRCDDKRRAAIFERLRHLRIKRDQLPPFAALVDAFGAGKRFDQPTVTVCAHRHHGGAFNPHALVVVADEDRRVANAVRSRHGSSVRLLAMPLRGGVLRPQPVDGRHGSHVLAVLLNKTLGRGHLDARRLVALPTALAHGQAQHGTQDRTGDDLQRRGGLAA